jgi:hypothetical protein
MPAWKRKGTSRRLRRFCVVGTYHGLVPGFVSHVGIYLDEGRSGGGKSERILHMRPPLEEAADFPVCLVGDAELTRSEANRIETWKAELDDEIRPPGRARQYTAQPPVLWEELHAQCPDSVEVTSKNTRTVRYRRFSCAGLVLDCYRSAGIELLDTVDKKLPLLDLPDLTA